MSVDQATGTHIPKKSMLFEFDDEVISVFDNMAERSIVGYRRAYELLTYFFNRVDLPRNSQVWDMGTTTGKGLRSIREGRMLDPYVNYWACDISEPAIKKVGDTLPWANTVQCDLRLGMPDDMEFGNVSAMVFGYTLQFIKSEQVRRDLISKAYDALLPGGTLVVLEKYILQDQTVNQLMQDAYIQFRRDNGYSTKEIVAKTKALTNAMWPKPPEFMISSMEEAGFTRVNTLYRDMNFGGMIAFK